MNDDFLFAEDDDENEVDDLGSWKVLIVDDEPEVHAVTKLALNDFSLNGKTLEFVSAYSGEEAKAIFKTHDDISVCYLMLLWRLMTPVLKWRSMFVTN